MKPTSRTLSWAFVIILLVVGIFTALGMILMHKQPLVLQGEAEATESRISGELPGRSDTFLVQEGDWVRQGDTLVVINSPEVHAKFQQVNALEQVAVLQNKKIRTRLSSNKRTSKHMTCQALTSGLNPSMYKATRSPPQGIRIPKISTILSASYIKPSHFTAPIRSMHHGSIT